MSLPPTAYRPPFRPRSLFHLRPYLSTSVPIYSASTLAFDCFVFALPLLCMQACAQVCAQAVQAFVQAFMQALNKACVHASVQACVHASVKAGVQASVKACVQVLRSLQVRHIQAYSSQDSSQTWVHA
eukprot:6196975-Pleurochrysis_carterae.AAC.1